MSTAQQQLLVAQQKLKTAEANAVRERKEQAAKDLETVRAEGRQVKAELEKLVQELSQFDALQNAFAREMAGWDAAIRRHYDLKPTDEDFPSQQDLDEWQKDLDELNAEREKVIQRRHASHQGGPSRLRAVQLDGRYQHLQYQQRNLLRIIRGERLTGSGWEGGIGPV